MSSGVLICLLPSLSSGTRESITNLLLVLFLATCTTDKVFLIICVGYAIQWAHDNHVIIYIQFWRQCRQNNQNFPGRAIKSCETAKSQWRRGWTDHLFAASGSHVTRPHKQTFLCSKLTMEAGRFVNIRENSQALHTTIYNSSFFSGRQRLKPPTYDSHTSAKIKGSSLVYNSLLETSHSPHLTCYLSCYHLVLNPCTALDTNKGQPWQL